jgi:hypothetical protein
MSVFKYILPSGKTFEVLGPAEATQEQADKIFYEQVAAGSLVDYIPGQTLTSAEVELAKFNLSRLDRGTAAVEDTVILSIVRGLPVVAPIPDLFNIPIVNPITQSDIALIGQDALGPPAVGILTPTEVAACMAQIIRLVEQPFTVATNEKGIGKYGFSAQQLERVGYIKPNTYEIYIKPDPSLFLAVLNSPSIWNGLNGVTGLDTILTDDPRQNAIPIQLMENGYQGLTAAGTIQPPVQAGEAVLTGEVYTNTSATALAAASIVGLVTQNSAALINISTKFGPQVADLWSKGLTLPSLTPTPDILGKASQYAASFAKGQLGAIQGQLGAIQGQLGAIPGQLSGQLTALQGQFGSLISGVKQGAGYVNTVNRATVDAAVTRIIGNAKVPTPNYTLPGSATALNNLDIKQAQTALTTVLRQGQQVLTLAQNLQGQGSVIAQNLRSQGSAITQRIL